MVKPSQICLTGYDEETTAKFESYANALGLTLSTKWQIGVTDILIAKSNAINNKPNITFKVLASILCNIPVVNESFLEDSYKANEILDHSKYVCNYRKVENQALFEGLDILFATTSMPTARLKTLLFLGKAEILVTQQQIDDKDKSLFNKRVMICANDTDNHQAKQLSDEFNCRVISESWVITCIYDYDFDNDDAVMRRLNMDHFDMTTKPWDDEDESCDDDDDHKEEEHNIISS